MDGTVDETEINFLEGGDIFTDAYRYGKEGFLRIKQAITGARKKAPPVLRTFLSDFGQGRILRLRVCRTPVYSAISWALNIISLGAYEMNKNRLGYDDMFHLYLLMDIEFFDRIKKTMTRLSIRLEKNHVVDIRIYKDKGEVCMNINPLPKGTVQDFIERAEALQGPSLWIYSAFSTNCQQFIQTLLRANNLLTPDLNAFILQPADSLVQRYVKDFADTITDIASRADILIHGEGLVQFIEERIRRNNELEDNAS